MAERGAKDGARMGVLVELELNAADRVNWHPHLKQDSVEDEDDSCHWKNPIYSLWVNRLVATDIMLSFVRLVKTDIETIWFIPTSITLYLIAIRRFLWTIRWRLVPLFLVWVILGWQGAGTTYRSKKQTTKFARLRWMIWWYMARSPRLLSFDCIPDWPAPIM